MDKLSQALTAAVQVQEQYSKMMEPWIEQREAIEKVLSPLNQLINNDINEQIQDSLEVREKWLGTINMATEAIQPMQSLLQQHAGMIEALQSVAKTPELLGLQNQLITNNLFAASDYIRDLTSSWEAALGISDIVERSIAAQNIAFLRLTPDYRELSLPRGGKKAIKGLTVSAAKEITQTDDILFNPKDGEYYHKNSPQNKVSADEISVAESSLEVFETISFSELIEFESLLFDDITFAKEHPVGEKIFNIMI